MMGKERDKHWTYQDEQTLREMYEKGVSPNEIALKLGRTPDAIRRKRQHLMQAEGGTNSQNCLPVDDKKIKSELFKRNVTLSEASINFGFSQSYLSQCSRSGWLKKAIVYALKAEYGIKYESIKPSVDKTEEKKKEPTGNPKKFSDYDMEVFYQLMLRAVKEGIQEVL